MQNRLRTAGGPDRARGAKRRLLTFQTVRKDTVAGCDSLFDKGTCTRADIAQTACSVSRGSVRVATTKSSCQTARTLGSVVHQPSPRVAAVTVHNMARTRAWLWSVVEGPLGDGGAALCRISFLRLCSDSLAEKQQEPHAFTATNPGLSRRFSALEGTSMFFRSCRLHPVSPPLSAWPLLSALPQTCILLCCSKKCRHQLPNRGEPNRTKRCVAVVILFIHIVV